MTFTQLLRPLILPTGLTGGTPTDLDGIPTEDLDPGVRAMVLDVTGAEVSFYHLRVGTDAESSPTIIRPDDWASTTNEKVWEKLTLI